MTDLNVGVLVAARDEYMNQLKNHLAPLILEGFQAIYQDAVKESPENPLRQFQIYLKQIPRWNVTILEGETKRIENKCNYLMDMVTAVFVSFVKILASVRLGGNHENIKIKIPEAQVFIHAVYIRSAECFYYEPQQFEIVNRPNILKSRAIINEAIKDTISSMIPIQNILKEYLSESFNSEIQEVINKEESDTESDPGLRSLSGPEMLNDFSQLTKSFEDTPDSDDESVGGVKEIFSDNIPKNLSSELSKEVPTQAPPIPDTNLDDLLGEKLDPEAPETGNTLSPPTSPTFNTPTPAPSNDILPNLDGESNFTAQLDKLNSVPSKFQNEITPDDSISQIGDFNFFEDNDNLVG